MSVEQRKTLWWEKKLFFLGLGPPHKNPAHVNASCFFPIVQESFVCSKNFQWRWVPFNPNKHHEVEILWFWWILIYACRITHERLKCLEKTFVTDFWLSIFGLTGTHLCSFYSFNIKKEWRDVTESKQTPNRKAAPSFHGKFRFLFQRLTCTPCIVALCCHNIKGVRWDLLHFFLKIPRNREKNEKMKGNLTKERAPTAPRVSCQNKTGSELLSFPLFLRTVGVGGCWFLCNLWRRTFEFTFVATSFQNFLQYCWPFSDGWHPQSFYPGSNQFLVSKQIVRFYRHSQHILIWEWGTKWE